MTPSPPSPSPLERAFETTLPALLRSRRKERAVAGRGLIAFAATGALETGYWVVSLADDTARRGAAGDGAPDVVVEADAMALALLFTGALDAKAAIESGVLKVNGDASLLVELAQACGAKTTV